MDPNIFGLLLSAEWYGMMEEDLGYCLAYFPFSAKTKN
jgi:hypothetical protein